MLSAHFSDVQPFKQNVSDFNFKFMQSGKYILPNILGQTEIHPTTFGVVSMEVSSNFKDK
jgi:hypothetical protein